jgi:hypothetical protein
MVLQQIEQQRQNHQLFDMVERLAEKIDNLKGRRTATSDYDREDISLPPHNGERDEPSCIKWYIQQPFVRRKMGKFGNIGYKGNGEKGEKVRNY